MEETLHSHRKAATDTLAGDPFGAVAYILLLIAALTLPFPYGGVTGDEALRLELLAFGAGAFTALSRRSRAPLGSGWIPAACLGGIATLGLFQLAPLPRGVLGLVSPESLAVWSRAAGVLALYGRAAPHAVVSLAPSETKGVVLLTLAYAVLFVCAALLTQTRPRRRLLLVALLAAALAEIGYALASTETLERLHGSFINPNNFAGYLQIALALAFGLLWYELRTGRHRRHGESRATRMERRIVPVSLAVLLWGAIAAAIGLSRSRGGVLAALLTVPLLVFLAVQHRRQGARAALGIVLALLMAAAFAATITRDGPLERFLGADPSELGSEGRVRIWRASLQAFRMYPLAGSGLGTFREAFRPVQPRGFDGLVEQAHDEPLQILVTGGVLGFALAAAVIGTAFALLWRGLFRQRHREESAYVLAAIGALFALMLHGLVEFNFSLAAVPATLAMLVGVAWSAAEWREGPEAAASARLAKRRRRSRRRDEGGAEEDRGGSGERRDPEETAPRQSVEKNLELRVVLDDESPDPAAVPSVREERRGRRLESHA
ncbi:MAG TPA: O-antigen ligase family protein [Thermoanaerobaculia bacterium]|nr:O-antigen ligase family protein [Thermoanaerobaculia bacterium]